MNNHHNTSQQYLELSMDLDNDMLNNDLEDSNVNYSEREKYILSYSPDLKFSNCC